jgi:hypothetical protein
LDIAVALADCNDWRHHVASQRVVVAAVAWPSTSRLQRADFSQVKNNGAHFQHYITALGNFKAKPAG